MDIIAPVIQQPYHVQPVISTKGVDGVLQHNLILHQVLPATVVEGGQQQVVLELGQHKMSAQTEQPLTTGQKLNLQVVATQPQLKLQISSGKADPSVLRLLHLFDHRCELGSQLSKLLSQRPVGATPSPAVTTTTAAATAATTTAAAATTAATTAAAAAATTAAASTIVEPVGHAAVGTVLSGANGATTLSRQSLTGAKVVSATVLNSALNNPAAASTSSVAGATNSTVVSILRPTLDSDLSVVQRQALEGALSSGQWGQLEHLTARLVGSMNSSDSRLLVNLARMLGLDFEALLAKDQPEQANQGLKGMLLSLQKNGELPESVRDSSFKMAQQLEVLQVCRLRLAQDGVLFLPLPLDFLEQGYVLFEQQSPESASDDEAAGHLVSLNFTMQQLGVMQVNLLFEQQGLFVRIKCADEETVALVEGYCEELHEALQPFSIRSIQVTTGAEDPALVLLRRLQSGQPGQFGQQPVFDARV